MSRRQVDTKFWKALLACRREPGVTNKIDKEPLRRFFRQLSSEEAKRIAAHVGIAGSQWEGHILTMLEDERDFHQTGDLTDFYVDDDMRSPKLILCDVVTDVDALPPGSLRCGDRLYGEPKLFLAPLREGGYELQAARRK
jgi:hypothetical protein